MHLLDRMNLNVNFSASVVLNYQGMLSFQEQERVHLDSINSSPIMVRTDKYTPLEDLVLLSLAKTYHTVLWGPGENLVDHALKVQGRSTTYRAPQLPQTTDTLLII